MEDLGLSGKLFLPLAIVTAAMLMPKAEPSPIIVEVGEWPEMAAPSIVVEVPDFPETKPTIVNVSPSEPVIVEEEVEVEKRVEVPVDRVVRVEVPVETRTCLVLDELPHFDLANALIITRPGEAWMLDGSGYENLVWLDDTAQPSESEIIGGWLASLEADC